MHGPDPDPDPLPVPLPEALDSAKPPSLPLVDPSWSVGVVVGPPSLPVPDGRWPPKPLDPLPEHAAIIAPPTTSQTHTLRFIDDSLGGEERRALA